jgi:hypothetical protein
MARMDDLHQRELGYLQQMVAGGVGVAIPAALQYCLQYKQSVPDWLLESSIELLCNLLKSEKSARRGRGGTHIARRRQDKIDYDRWGTVLSQRDAQKDQLRQLDTIKVYGDDLPLSWREDRENLQAWSSTTLNRAFECSSMLLEGTEAFGSPEAIKRSYFKVERNMRTPAQAVRYYHLDPMFLHERLGIKWEPFVRPGRKCEPLYNLTL